MDMATKKMILGLGWAVMMATAPEGEPECIPVHDSASLLEQFEELGKMSNPIDGCVSPSDEAPWDVDTHRGEE